ncbi:MAG TPA: hypothetical protein VLA62_02215 [Solirubrobacterales bacterium]|nr:hypothetical protein [Solirubrobacterales bacterium]
MADNREYQQGGQSKPGQGHEEQPKPGQQHQPGSMDDMDPQRGQRGDQESGKPVQLDEQDRQLDESRKQGGQPVK